jgi:subtilisin family serine protease
VWTLLLAASAAAQGSPSWVADELLVKLRAGASSHAAEAAFRAVGAQKLGEIEVLRVQRLRVSPAARDAVAAALAQRPEVEFVENNHRFPPDAVPDDPDYPLQWHLGTLGLPMAWEFSTGSDEVVVAILDSGVDSSHPDLMSRLLPGMDTMAGGNDTSDLTGHGTRVAGAAAAAADNAIGVASPNWHGQILPFRVTDATGWTSAWALSAALTEAADQGARVANMSFGGVAGSATVRAAAQYMTEQGGVVVAGSGNCGCRESISDTPYILSVGATDQNDDLAGFSSTGDYVDFTAPGVSIRTTKRGGGYSSPSGTSYSAPVLAGAIALLLAIDPQLTASDLESLLADTAVDLGAPGWDESFGHGRIDVHAAVVHLPEPGGTLLLGAGLCALLACGRARGVALGV